MSGAWSFKEGQGMHLEGDIGTIDITVARILGTST